MYADKRFEIPLPVKEKRRLAQFADILRSGKYRQVRGAFVNDCGYCVRGAYYAEYGREDIIHSDPLRIAEQLNDRCGWSFPQIAEYLESYDALHG